MLTLTRACIVSDSHALAALRCRGRSAMVALPNKRGGRMAVVCADLRYPAATAVPTRRLAVRDVASGGPASRVSSTTTTTSAPSRNSSVTTCTPTSTVARPGCAAPPTGCSERRHAPMGLRPVGRPAVLPRAPAPCSTVREDKATDSQPRVTAGAVGRRRPSGPGVLGCAARSVARATQLWRIGSSPEQEAPELRYA